MTSGTPGGDAPVTTTTVPTEAGAPTGGSDGVSLEKGLVQVTTLASGTCSGQANCASPPLAGVTVAIRRGDREVTRAVTDANGRATFTLDPGDYVVAGQPKEGYRVTPGPWSVTVEKGSSADVELYYETGAQ